MRRAAKAIGKPTNKAWSRTPFSKSGKDKGDFTTAVCGSHDRDLRRTNSRKRSHHAAADESIAGWYWSILRDRTSCYLVLSSTAPMHPPQRTALYSHRTE